MPNAKACLQCGLIPSGDIDTGTSGSRRTDELVGRVMGMLLSHTIWYFAHLFCIFAHIGVLIDCLIIEVTLPSRSGRPKILIGAFIVVCIDIEMSKSCEADMSYC